MKLTDTACMGGVFIPLRDILLLFSNSSISIPPEMQSAHEQIVARQKKCKNQKNDHEGISYKKSRQHSHCNPEQGIPYDSFHMRSPNSFLLFYAAETERFRYFARKKEFRRKIVFRRNPLFFHCEDKKLFYASASSSVFSASAAFADAPALFPPPAANPLPEVKRFTKSTMSSTLVSPS